MKQLLAMFAIAFLMVACGEKAVQTEETVDEAIAAADPTPDLN